MVSGGYVPESGELVWLDFDPQLGREQTRRWPALVVSPKSYNARSGLALFCPVTSRVKGYPFEVGLPAGLAISGVILADQIRSLDYRLRRAELAGEAPAGVLGEVRAKLRALIG